jgi:hypothetical protein
MGLINLKQGPFVPDGGYGEEKRGPGILEQMDRMRNGLPREEPTGILEQMDRMRNGLPREVPTGILAEIEREIAERGIEREIRQRQKEWETWEWGPVGAPLGYGETFFDTWVRMVLYREGGAPTGLQRVPGSPASRSKEDVRKWFEALAENAATQYNVPPAIFKGLIQRESKWDLGARSSLGALGLTQLMPDTARDLDLRVDAQVDERLDAAKNIYAGARYLRAMYERFYEGKTEIERWRLALAAYNWGRNNLNTLLRKIGKSGKQGTVEWREIAVEAPRETRDYVLDILGESGDVNGYAKEYGYVE